MLIYNLFFYVLFSILFKIIIIMNSKIKVYIVCILLRVCYKENISSVYILFDKLCFCRYIYFFVDICDNKSFYF